MTNIESFLCLPVSFENVCTIYPPTVKEVVQERNFNSFLKTLLLSQEEIEDLLIGREPDLKSFPTPLEFLLNNCYNNKEYEELTKEAFNFFIKEPVIFLYDIKAIWIGSLEDLGQVESIGDLRLLSENNFFNFQNALREVIGEDKKEPPNPNEDPRVKKIKAKGRRREQVKAKQGKGIKLITSLSAICCMGIGLTPLNIGELSYAAVSQLIATYQLKEAYETDIRSLQAGADSKNIKPKYWISNLDN